ncbi:SAM-dependent methyltransferase [Pseudoroseicyclus sp. H15]
MDRLIVAAAREGKRVVRLKSGDPSIFGRAAEEVAAARAAGIEVEIVPGITAASSLMRTLTERGDTDMPMAVRSVRAGGGRLRPAHRPSALRRRCCPHPLARRSAPADLSPVAGL